MFRLTVIVRNFTSELLSLPGSRRDLVCSGKIFAGD